MDSIATLKTRRSVRQYSQKYINKKDIKEIIDAARYAPTARNIQPWDFIIVTDKDILKKLAALADNGRFISSCAACIAVFCSDTKYYIEDGAAATVNIMLAARAMGIGSCWVAGDKKPYCAEVASLLGVPVQLKLVSLVSLGYPVSETAFYKAQKRPLEELIHWEKF